MRTTRLAAIAAGLLLLALVAPVAAKEGLVATLDAPIGMGTPAGTVIVVGLTVVGPDETGNPHPVVGTPIYLRLTGQHGAFTREAAAADRVDGHYLVTIAIPEGGARAVEVGIHGTYDLPIGVEGETLVFGSVTGATAQLAAPPASARPTPVAAAPAAAASVPSAPPPAQPLPPVLPLAGVAAALLGLLALARVASRRRGDRRVPAPPVGPS
jgi:hypothetical protein